MQTIFLFFLLISKHGASSSSMPGRNAGRLRFMWGERVGGVEIDQDIPHNTGEYSTEEVLSFRSDALCGHRFPEKQQDARDRVKPDFLPISKPLDKQMQRQGIYV
ncbi:hypothetical protein AVEN_146425-1 [Araneus ventricosus]|uniref:Uncharacterized protein n=1 Tax=Araneus ventricosus TaxID=182803 RepID=A0A4Y2NFY7_ARAVE|nr:hypothetical protein AVEN_146425-1 [Araneus ventricosus]